MIEALQMVVFVCYFKQRIGKNVEDLVQALLPAESKRTLTHNLGYLSNIKL